MVSPTLLFGATLAAAGLASAQSTRDEPCAVVSRMVQDLLESNSDIMIEAAAALACLDSVPLDVDEGKALVDELKLYLSWQSNIEYYSRPPPGYNEDQINVLGTLDGIRANLDAGNYTSEYDLHYDLSLALGFAYDFHMIFDTDIMNVFLFQRGGVGELALISVSEDGQEVPKIYNYYEWRENDGKLGSPIVRINGEDADSYLDYWGRFSPWHDSDARYNRQFVQMAQFPPVGGAASEFSLSTVFDERNVATTAIEYENGTKFEYSNYALPLAEDTITLFARGIADGAEFYNAFCNLPNGFPDIFLQQLNLSSQGLFGKRDELPLDEAHGRLPNHPRELLKRKLWEDGRRGQTTVSNERRQTRDSVTQLDSYPEPIMITRDGYLSGYYLSGGGNDDVAVIAIPSFFPVLGSAAVEFQDTLQAFLQKAKKDGKKRLIIDLRGNTGGRIFLGYDLFKQLFPTMTPYGATRFRANDAFDVVGQANAAALDGVTYADAIEDLNTGKYGGAVVVAWSSIFNYKLNLDEKLEPFESWPDMFGPHEFNGDRYTSLQRYNFDDVFADDNQIDVSGYGVRADSLGEQPFEASNIVLLQDGGCGSTCAIFAEMAKAQGRIRQVVVGGAPRKESMQSVAGSKGAQVYKFSYVYLQAFQAYNMLGAQASLDETEIGQLVKAVRPLRRSTWDVATGSTSSSINLRDNIRQGDESQTPLEFVYEAADCRLFYTNGHMNNVETLWNDVANAKKNGTGCVDGSTGDKSSLDGGADVPGSDVSGAVPGAGVAGVGRALAAAAALLAAAALV